MKRKLCAMVAMLCVMSMLASCGSESSSEKSSSVSENTTTKSVTATALSDEKDTTEKVSEVEEETTTTTTAATDDDPSEYTTTTQEMEWGSETPYKVDEIGSIPIDNVVAYDKDGIKVTITEVKSDGNKLSEDVIGLYVVCNIENTSSNDVKLGMTNIHINNRGIGNLLLENHPEAKSGESITDSFEFLGANIISQINTNLGDICVMDFCLTIDNGSGEEVEGDPVTINFK